jgi:hypothetical protein
VPTILIIRHAEKPELGGDAGIDGAGLADPKSLTPRGWQRAGAWAELFAPSLMQPAALPCPTAIYASAPASHSDIAAGNGGSRSRRPLETVTPLAAKLGIEVNLGFGKGREGDLAASITKLTGVTLVCWQHEDIVSIAVAIATDNDIKNLTWPGDRFNVIFRLTRPDDGVSWNFDQVVPVMLTGDSAKAI